jgi:type VI secretion system secreted protein VgrG
MFPDTLFDSSSAALTALLGPWSQAFKQTNRLLRLRTPLGADALLAETLKGIECISGQAEGVTGFKLQLDALSLNAHLELKTLIGQPVLLEVMTDQSRTALRPLHGHITVISCVGANGGMARYRLTIEPWLSFLGHGRDSAVFQDQNVLDIVQSVLADYQPGGAYQGAGKLQPDWRLDVLDASVYPQRSLTTQYQESDLAFIERLLLEEGLFYWFEHSGDAASSSLGAHTMVIADHNGAFKPNARADVRFSQAQGTIADDTVDRWRPQRAWHTHGVEMASWDYRTLGTRPVAEHASEAPANTPALLSQDTPGAYAYENAAQGQRLAANQLQALSVAGQRITAAGSVRAFAPGSTFTLSGHASDLASQAGQVGQAGEPTRYILLSVTHHARNNLSAELQAAAGRVSSIKSAYSPIRTGASSYEIDSSLLPAQPSQPDRQAPDIFYRNAGQVLPLATPYRASARDAQGRQIHPKPSVQGSQTALVIGAPGQQLTTERDHRIKVQFAWQRGANSQSRLSHPAPDGHSGAPAADAAGATTGTWVRVATALAPIAGANWGAVALPRIGQEVLVTYLDGDIDRPVVVGAVYNGRGQDNSQANQVAQGAANATGNAPMWFPGDQEASGQGGKAGKLPGHAHNAVLSGIKSQAMSASQSGTAGYNQLVFDDSPGQSRIGLQSHGEAHKGSSELNLGQLRQQTDNQRLAPTGYGFELKTEHSGAIRAGAGLLLSADKRGGNDSGSSSAQMASEEAQAQLQSAQDLLRSLSETAQAHKAMLPVLQTLEAKPDKLPAMAQLKHSIEVMQASANGSGRAGGGEGGSAGGGGGAGQAVAYSEPLLVMSAPAGIALLTPQSAMLSAGQTSAISAGQDINLLAQGNAGHAVKGGISLFSYGKASNPQKPNQETGIRLHAASGRVSSQSQSNKTQVTADKAITVASTTDAVSIQAPKHVLLTAQGAYIKLEGGNIEVHAPGLVAFKAEMKSWTGPQSSSPTLPKFSVAPLNTGLAPIHTGTLDCYDLFFNKNLADIEYAAKFSDGKVTVGKLDAAGKTARIGANAGESFEVLVGSSGAWGVVGDDGDYRNNTGEAHHDEDE